MARLPPEANSAPPSLGWCPVHRRADPSRPEPPSTIEHDPNEPEPLFTKRKRMTWAKLLARVFAIDVTVCANPACGGTARIIAWITDAAVIDRILTHLGIHAVDTTAAPARAPPQAQLWPDD